MIVLIVLTMIHPNLPLKNGSYEIIITLVNKM